MQKLILCSLWIMCFSLSVFSQNNKKTSEIELSEIIINSKNEKKLGTHKVSKISLQLRPINSAHDFLKTVPGLFIAPSISK